MKTKRSSYDQGRLDVIAEIFSSAKEGKDICEKMDNIFDTVILILRRMNNEHVKGAGKNRS